MKLGTIVDEFASCDFGDKRLDSRLKSIAKTFSENPELSIHAACGSASESKGAYRFLQNEKITPGKILESHVEATLDRIAAFSGDILIVQDTTDLIYTQFPSIEGLGEHQKGEGYKDGVKGLHLHNSIAVSKCGVPLGVMKQSFYTNEDYREKQGRKIINERGSGKKIPFEMKKSFRWVEHFRATQNLIEPIASASRIIHVADRECDIYEFLQAVDSEGCLFVVRSSSNRMTRESFEVKNLQSIDMKLDQAKSYGTVNVNKDGKSIKCSVKSIQTILQYPQRTPEAKSKPLSPMEMFIVEIKSTNASESLHWRLLTNIDCLSFEGALDIAGIYKKRWPVECFHRILKSGFNVEKARLGDRQRIENLTSILSVAAWHIYWLYQFGRTKPQTSAKKIMNTETLTVLRISSKKLKVRLNSNATIGQAVLALAKLGGFAARKNDGPPGMINIWRGWRKLHERLTFMEEMSCG